MKDHLLSIFPLKGMEEYARVSCIVLESSDTDCSQPFTVTRDALIEFLALTFSVEESATILFMLDRDHPVQQPISTDQARHFGFVPKVN